MGPVPSPWATSGTKAYDRAHNPFSYESDINCAAQDVPYPGVSGAVNVLSGSSAPAFVWLGPDETHNMHPPATVAAGDVPPGAHPVPLRPCTHSASGGAVRRSPGSDVGSRGERAGHGHVPGGRTRMELHACIAGTSRRTVILPPL